MFKGHTAAHWQNLLGKADVCCSLVKTMDEAVAGDLYRSREMAVDLPGNNGISTIGVSVKLSRTPGRVRTPPESFGQSTRAILSELGFSKRQIEAFQQEKII